MSLPSPNHIQRAMKAHVPLKALRDRLNRLRFGPHAPLSDERLCADPRTITQTYLPKPPNAPHFRRRHSGLVARGDWDLSVMPLPHTAKVQALWQHFDQGLPWKDTGIFDATLAEIAKKGASDGLRTLPEIQARYDRIDRMYDEIASAGRLQTRQELPGWQRRELGGIVVHITREGTAIRGGGGQHRFEIARILRLPEIPLQLGVTHLTAVQHRHLENYRAT